MSVLQKEYVKFIKEIKLTEAKKKGLYKSRKAIRDKIRNYFKENKPHLPKPKFYGQGSVVTDTAINPIPLGKKRLPYDIDDGVYFIGTANEIKELNIDSLYGAIGNAVDSHTDKPIKNKRTCVRVYFADDHYFDLPVYRKNINTNTIELGHRSKGWLNDDPRAFADWFAQEKKSKPNLNNIVRLLKAWKNFQEHHHSNLKLPSGFELTVLATYHYHHFDNLDKALLHTCQEINNSLRGNFSCMMPTVPKDENILDEYSDKRKADFLKKLSDLFNYLEEAQNEPNELKATEILRDKVFGNRFPKGQNIDSSTRADDLDKGIGGASIKPKPYG
ncbi:MAG: hypothetical protein WBA74_08475 [Cyclobacteriaceae bacterium]